MGNDLWFWGPWGPGCGPVWGPVWVCVDFYKTANGPQMIKINAYHRKTKGLAKPKALGPSSGPGLGLMGPLGLGLGLGLYIIV